MRRLRLHLYFWLVYLLYDTLLHFTWMGPSLPQVSTTAQLLMGIKSALVLLPIKFLLVYYIVFRGALKILIGNTKRLWPFLELISVFLFTAILFRFANHFFIEPIIYSDHSPRFLFNARSIFIAILEMGLVGGIALALKLYNMQTAAREREKDLVKQKLETELKFLKNQTNPHFLFNTLNNIYALSRKKSDKTPEVVMKLSELLSFMIYESGQETITVSEELKIVEDYIDLQRIRFNNRLTISIDKNVDDGTQRIAPLLLLPVVENAFKHGVSETRFNSFIHLDVILNKNRFHFSIENNIENGKENNTNGNIGLSNLKRQLELMYGEHQLNVEKADHKFKVLIDINLDSYEKIHMYYR